VNEFDVCANRHGGNPESEEAFLSTDRAAIRSRVLDYIHGQGTAGATADEVCTAFGAVHNSIAPRLTELLCAGSIVRTDLRRTTRLGRRAAVHVAGEFVAKPLVTDEAGQGLLYGGSE
jgi:hypothetical protein